MATVQSQVQYVMTLNDLTGTGFRNAEANAMRFEGVVNNINSGLRTLGSVLGVGIGVHYFTSAIEEFAKYETALIRIKNASKNAADGIANQKFIMSEATNLKLPIDEATEAYGKFLSQIGNSEVASEKIRALHHDVLVITKSLGMPAAKMDAAVLDIGKLLGEGVMEAKTTRALERVLPRLTNTLAEQYGVSRQVLSRALSSGAFTKAAKPSDVLLNVMHELADQLKGGLPEALNSTQSALNEVHNAWFDFKKDVISDLKPQIFDAMEGIKTATHWLKEHKGAVEGVLKALATIIPLYIGYKTAVGAINFVSNLLVSNAVKEVSATEAKTIAYNALATAMERVAFATESMAASQIASFTPWAGGVGSAASGAAAAEGVEVAAATGGIAATVTSVLGTATVAAALFALYNSWISRLKPLNEGDFIDYSQGTNYASQAFKGAPKIEVNYQSKNDMGIVRPIVDSIKQQQDEQKADPNFKYPWQTEEAKKKAKGGIGGGGSIFPEKDKVTGNRPITYNITIKEMNGVNNSTFELQSLSKTDTSEFADKLLGEMINVLNDSQIRQGY